MVRALTGATRHSVPAVDLDGAATEGVRVLRDIAAEKGKSKLNAGCLSGNFLATGPDIAVGRFALVSRWSEQVGRNGRNGIALIEVHELAGPINTGLAIGAATVRRPQTHPFGPGVSVKSPATQIVPPARARVVAAVDPSGLWGHLCYQDRA